MNDRVSVNAAIELFDGCIRAILTPEAPVRKHLVCTFGLVGVAFLAGCQQTSPPEPAAASAQIHGVKTYLNQDNLQARYPSYDTLVTEMRQGGVDAVFTTLYEG